MTTETDSSNASILAITAVGILVMYMVTSCSEQSSSDMVTVEGQFDTLQECVSEISSKVGPLNIVIDKPDQVAGKTRDRQHFGCARQVTGTRGTYYYGWYKARRR